MASLVAGTVIGKRYRIERLLGEGGMGEVYEARGLKNEAVAIKLLHERAMQDADIVARFKREAEIASRIRSPYVARILAAGKERNGRLWIAFERLLGEGLDQRLKREHYLPMADVASMVSDTLKGLVAAHQAGVVHRDIKPANLFLETIITEAPASPNGLSRLPGSERTRILDFGISKVRRSDANEPSLTAFDATLGSFAYMAPEQVRGSARVDFRADLYAIGAVCFRSLAGRLPYEGTTAVALVALKLDRDPPTLASVTGDEWPTAIETFLQKLMARDRDSRFPSAEEALQAWEKTANLLPQTDRTRPPPPSVLPEPMQVTQSTFVDD
jgi:eukaryotic-like serine/threonine-protein kinase